MGKDSIAELLVHCPDDDEPGELAFGYHKGLDTFTLVVRDMDKRPIACVVVDRVALLTALSFRARNDTHQGPSVAAWFHVHTLKDLISQ